MPTQIDVERLGNAKGIGKDLAVKIAAVFPTYEKLAKSTSTKLAAMVDGIESAEDPRANAAILFAEMMLEDDESSSEEPSKGKPEELETLDIDALLDRGEKLAKLNEMDLLRVVKPQMFPKAIADYEPTEPTSIGYMLAAAVAKVSGTTQVIAIERRSKRINRNATAARLQRLMSQRTKAQAVSERTIVFDNTTFNLIGVGINPGESYPRDPIVRNQALDENNVGEFGFYWGPLGEPSGANDELRHVVDIAVNETGEFNIKDSFHRERFGERLNPKRGEVDNKLTADSFERAWPKAIQIYFDRNQGHGDKPLTPLTIAPNELGGSNTTEPESLLVPASLAVKKRLQHYSVQDFIKALNRFNQARLGTSEPMQRKTAQAYKYLFNAIYGLNEKTDALYAAIALADLELFESGFSIRSFTEFMEAATY